jgi:exonuclease III
MKRGLFLLAFVAATAGGGTLPVKLVTWNVHGLPFTGAPRRLPEIAKYVADQQPDVIGFQEVWLRPYAKILKQTFLNQGYRAVEKRAGFIRFGGLLVFVKE